MALDVSFVIVSWNAKDYLVQCLQKIKESRTDLTITSEVIVVDNDSSDGSPEAVEQDFPEVNLIRSGGNYGFAKGNNIGIEAAQGRYLFLINSDVDLIEGCLEKMVAFMDQNPKAGMASPKILNADGSLQPNCRKLPSLWNTFTRALALDALFPKSEFFAGSFMNWWKHDESKTVGILSGCFWVIRREALEQVGGLDERYFMYSEDVDWCKRFSDANWEVWLNIEAQAIHYGGGSSSNAPVRFYLEMQRSKMQYWRKHYGLPKVLAIGSITLLHQLLRLPPLLALYLLKPSKRKSTSNKLARCTAGILDLFKPGRTT